MYRWFLVRANPSHDDAGKLTGWYGATTDIHDHKLAEHALREVDQRKDEFLATLAHELRNPLAPLRNCLHILRMAEQGEAGAHVDMQRLHGVMERQVAQLVRLVDDLLEVSRITRGMVPLHLQAVALSDVVERAVETSRPLIDGAHHALDRVGAGHAAGAARRSGSPGAGVVEPAQQRGEVHRARRAHRAGCASRRR